MMSTWLDRITTLLSPQTNEEKEDGEESRFSVISRRARKARQVVATTADKISSRIRTPGSGGTPTQHNQTNITDTSNVSTSTLPLNQRPLRKVIVHTIQPSPEDDPILLGDMDDPVISPESPIDPSSFTSRDIDDNSIPSGISQSIHHQPTKPNRTRTKEHRKNG